MSDTPFNINFRNIDLIEKSMFLPPKIDQVLTNFQFNFLVDVKIAPSEKIAIAVTEVAILDSNAKKLAQFKTVCIFEFSDFDQVFIKTSENKYDIPINLEIILKSAGISTTRGIIYSELRGTYLHTAILPLIDIATSVKLEHKKMSKAKNKKG